MDKPTVIHICGCKVTTEFAALLGIPPARIPCSVCVDWAIEYNDATASERTRLRLPYLVPLALPGAHSHLTQAREYATAKRTVLLRSYRKELEYSFPPPEANAQYKIALRMVRTRKFREYAIWIHRAGTWFGEEVLGYSKKVWTAWAMNSFPGDMPYYRLRETGLEYAWKRSELVPLMLARNESVRMIVLELMAGAKGH